MSYTLYIDESGDEGIQEAQIKRGASPLFFLGAYLIHESEKNNVRSILAAHQKKLRKENFIHFNQLKHEQKIFLCRGISDLPIRAFGLISDKSELDRNGYRKQASKRHGDFYNTNVKYLLENVCEYCIKNDLEISKIVFEKQDGKNYERLKNFIRLCQQNPKHPRSEFLKHIVAGNIIALTKLEEPLLQISDAIASSFNRMCIPNHLNICEPRYVDEFKNVIVSDSLDQVLNTGVKIVPNFGALSANENVKTHIKNLDSKHAKRY